MTHRAGGSSRGIPRIWVLPLAVVTAILAAIAMRVLSLALVLDVVAWWPVWLTLVVVTLLTGGRRLGRLKVSGLVAIIVTAALIVFVVGHVQGWPINPSTTRYLAGPPVGGVEEASLTAVIEGDLVLVGGSGFLYEVDLLPEGGDIGIPTARERATGDTVDVELVPPAMPGLDRSSGWSVRLTDGPLWALHLGGTLDADLTGLQVTELRVEGGGVVALGPVEVATPVSVDGGFSFSVPAGVPVTVEGAAQVPDTWESRPGGWAAPVEGVGWVISVAEDSAVSLGER